MSRKYTPGRNLAGVTVKCGYDDPSRPDWLIPMAKDKLPQPSRQAFPRPKKVAPGKPGASLNRIKVAAAARGSMRNGIEVKAAPEDIFFKATKAMVTERMSHTTKVIKKLARKPTKASFR